MGRERILTPSDLLTLFTAYYFHVKKKKKLSDKHKVFGIPNAFSDKWNTNYLHPIPSYGTKCCNCGWWNNETSLKGLWAGTIDRKTVCMECKNRQKYPEGLEALGVVQGFTMTWKDYSALREYVERQYSPRDRQGLLVGVGDSL